MHFLSINTSRQKIRIEREFGILFGSKSSSEYVWNLVVNQPFLIFFFYKFRAVSFEFPLFLTSYLDEGNCSSGGSLLVLMILLVVF